MIPLEKAPLLMRERKPRASGDDPEQKARYFEAVK